MSTKKKLEELISVIDSLESLFGKKNITKCAGATEPLEIQGKCGKLPLKMGMLLTVFPPSLQEGEPVFYPNQSDTTPAEKLFSAGDYMPGDRVIATLVRRGGVVTTFFGNGSPLNYGNFMMPAGKKFPGMVKDYNGNGVPGVVLGVSLSHNMQPKVGEEILLRII
jgi:hypothetical protein